MFEYTRLIPIVDSRFDNYHFDYDGRRFDDSLIDTLNVLGREKWKLVAFDGKYYILVREISK